MVGRVENGWFYGEQIFCGTWMQTTLCLYLFVVLANASREVPYLACLLGAPVVAVETWGFFQFAEPYTGWLESAQGPYVPQRVETSSSLEFEEPAPDGTTADVDSVVEKARAKADARKDREEKF